MKFSFSALCPRRAFKPLLAAATLALLVGCGLPPHMQNQFLMPEYRTALYNKHPVGEMTVKDKALLLVSVPSQRQQEVRAKYRTLLADEGILHVFPDKSRRCYSTSTLPALSAAYLDDDGTIINITDMPANSSGECSARPATRVLTMPYQWFADNGIEAGDVFSAFKTVTEPRRKELLAGMQQATEQRLAVKKAAQEKEKAEEQRLKAEAERVKAEQLAARKKAEQEKQARAQQAALLQRMQGRGKPDVKVEDMREVTLGSGNLLIFQKDGGFALLPNEAFLYTSPGNLDVYSGEKFQPLSIAYVGEDGRIARLANVTAYHQKNYQINNAEKAAYVLVTQFGWFEKHGVKPGDTLSFKPVTAKRRDELYAQGAAVLAQLNQADKQTRIAAAKQAGLDAGKLLQAGKAYNHSYLCEKEEAQGLLSVQSRGADGSVNAVYDLAVADIEKNTVAGVRVQMKGVKNAQGGYDFTPVSTLKSSPKYKVNRILAFGDLAQLSVNLSGSACATPEQMPLWSKVPDSFESVSMPISVNLAVRALHRADFYYKAERVGTRLPNGARANEEMQKEGRAKEDLGIRLVAAGRALPGEPATTGHLFRVDAATAIEAGRSQRDDRSKRQYIKTAGEYALSQSCSEPRSAYQCLHQHVVVHNNYVLGQKLQPKTGAWQNYRKGLDSSHYSTMRSATELELFNSQVKAAQSEKVRWTPLDFAPHYEMANYEILPGQPSADDSLVKLNYRYARYVYLYSRVMMQEKGEAFLKNYTVKMTGEEAKERPMSSNETNVPFLVGAVGRSICSDRTFTVSITPKTAAARRDRALDVDWIMLAERLENGRPSVERRIHASHYALNAKNGYSARQTITFPCVTKSSKSETKMLWFTETETIELKNLKLGVDIVRVYE